MSSIDSILDQLGSPQHKRWASASKVKDLQDVSIGPLEVWNYDACPHHDTPTPSCVWHLCGGSPFKHQNVTATFSYMARKSLVGNNTGTGKTLSALLTLAIAHSRGEDIKAVLVVPSISVKQWIAEANRWTPGFKTIAVPPKTPKKDRLSAYASDWNLMIIGYHVFTKDIDHIEKIQAKQAVVDDVDPALNTKNQTYSALRRICSPSDIVIVQNATPVSMQLMQLYAATCLIGGADVWGSQANFARQYVKRENVWIKFKDPKKKARRTYKTVGYKNLDHFSEKFGPMHIRITYEDIADDVAIPDIVTEQVYLDMSPKQVSRYAELQTGVRTILNKANMPAQQKAIGALAAFTIGSQICSGTFALKNTSGSYEGDGPDASPKLDWIMQRLTGEWAEEKVVVYSKFRGSIMALQKRLEREGVGYSTVWGMEPNPEVRKEEMDRFWQDPNTRVMIISVSGERSLNLQNARILVMWDMPLNPARVNQLAGRIRRVGSSHSKVFVFELLHSDTQEERYMAALSTRQALFDYVFDVDTDDEDADTLLIQKLDPEELLRLIQP